MSTFKKYTSTPPGSELLTRWNYVVPEDYVPCPLCNSKEHKIWYELGNTKTLICSNCNFKYISPRLSERQTNEYYSKIYTDETFSKDFEGRKHDFFNDPIERSKKTKDRHVEIELTNRFTQKGDILDVGCGSGLYFEGLKGNHKLFGIEMSQYAAEYTRERFNVHINRCDIKDVDYDDDFFDVINMTYVIEHLLDPKSIMRKVYGWLKPGGLLIVSSPNWGGIISKIYKELFRLNNPCQHINLWEKETLKKFLADSGFSVKKSHYPYFGTEYFNLYEIKRLFRNTFYRLLLPVTVRLGCNPPLEKILSPPFWGNIMVIECYKRG